MIPSILSNLLCGALGALIVTGIHIYLGWKHDFRSRRRLALSVLRSSVVETMATRHGIPLYGPAPATSQQDLGAFRRAGWLNVQAEYLAQYGADKGDAILATLARLLQKAENADAENREQAWKNVIAEIAILCA